MSVDCLIIFRSRSSRGNVLKLKVNFLPEIITLYKEVRNLKSLGFRVPLAIVNKAHQANQTYPFAISLIESVRTYERTLNKVSCWLLFSFDLLFKLSPYQPNYSLPHMILVKSFKFTGIIRLMLSQASDNKCRNAPRSLIRCRFKFHSIM